MKKLSIYTTIYALFMFGLFEYFIKQYEFGGLLLYIMMVVVVQLVLTIGAILKKNKSLALITNCGASLANLCAPSFPLSYSGGHFYFYFPTDSYYFIRIACLLVFYLFVQFFVQRKYSVMGSVILFILTLCFPLFELFF